MDGLASSYLPTNGFWATVCKTVRPILSDRCLFCLSCLSVTWPNGRIKMKLGMQVGLGPGDFVLDGDQAIPKKETHPPIFGPCLLCGQWSPDQLLLSSCMKNLKSVQYAEWLKTLVSQRNRNRRENERNRESISSRVSAQLYIYTVDRACGRHVETAGFL